MLNYEAILNIMGEELENQPCASEETINTRSALDDALDAYIEAVQKDAFYLGYITAMKKMEGK